MNLDPVNALARGVRAYFAVNNISASVPAVGWVQYWRQDNQGPGDASRVCFLPGKVDLTAGGPPKIVEAGEFSKPRFHQGSPRELERLRQIVTLAVWGVDNDALDDEEAQREATMTLYEQTRGAMHSAVDPVTGVNVGLADIVMQAPFWVRPPLEQAFGMVFGAYFVLSGSIFHALVETTTPQPSVARNPLS